MLDPWRRDRAPWSVQEDEMAEAIAPALGRWRTGIHPRATGMRIESIGRVNLELGEALRLELSDGKPGGADTVNLQYYIATELGTWALWLSCAGDDATESEASLRALTPPFAAPEGA
jgi:hypothetical protein